MLRVCNCPKKKEVFISLSSENFQILNLKEKKLKKYTLPPSSGSHFLKYPNQIVHSFHYREIKELILTLNPSFFQENERIFHEVFLQAVISMFRKDETLFVYKTLINAIACSAELFNLKKFSTKIFSGIYLIWNTKTQVFYIGQSSDIFLRFSQHKELLLLGNHHNSNLQQSFPLECGKKNSYNQKLYMLEHFLFLIIEIDIHSKKQRLLREDFFIQNWSTSLYNFIKIKKTY